MPPDSDVSLLTDIPQELQQQMAAFLDANPAWHQDDFVTCAIAMFLMQVGDSTASAARIYLDRTFKRVGGVA